MSESVLDARGRWTIAFAGGVALLMVMLLLLRLPAPTTPLAAERAMPPNADVRMARTDDTDIWLKQEAELRDLRPLFLPTERNAALPEPRLEPGRTFLENETPKLMFTEAEARVSKDLPPVVRLDGKPVERASPADVLSPHESPLTLQGFGRTESTAVAEFQARGGYVEVTALADGTRVLGEKLPIEGRPWVEKSWAPVQFIAVIDAAGLVGPLVVTEGSRVDEVDTHFRNYLAQEFRIGARLPPGFYRVSVAP